jgi:hypothetical protein
MNLDYENNLERAVERELKALPEIAAPGTLISRVMSRLEQDAARPWYQRTWMVWPLGLRVASLVLLLTMVGGLCFAGWKVSQAEAFLGLVHRANLWFTNANTLWSTLNSVVNVGVLLIKKLGTTFIVAGLLVMAMGYTMCIGVGTVYVKFAFRRR